MIQFSPEAQSLGQDLLVKLLTALGAKAEIINLWQLLKESIERMKRGLYHKVIA